MQLKTNTLYVSHVVYKMCCMLFRHFIIQRFILAFFYYIQSFYTCVMNLFPVHFHNILLLVNLIYIMGLTSIV